MSLIEVVGWLKPLRGLLLRLPVYIRGIFLYCLNCEGLLQGIIVVLASRENSLAELCDLRHLLRVAREFHEWLFLCTDRFWWNLFQPPRPLFLQILRVHHVNIWWTNLEYLILSIDGSQIPHRAIVRLLFPILGLFYHPYFVVDFFRSFFSLLGGRMLHLIHEGILYLDA